ncbi:MAG: hypothetical protein GY700_17185, partial [Propionibacteriaceae bacterium]|nr:hypothetical protein [Propionibacteriaceae bacterium]
LGGTIINGYQLNVAAGSNCMNALESGTALPVGCYIPDALYFASNIGDEGVGAGRGTCTWVEYDVGGRMTHQIVKTGCSSCTDQSAATGPGSAVCPGVTSGPAEDQVAATRTDYVYEWNALSQLKAAERYDNGYTPGVTAPAISMSYLYDFSGNRVIRQKADIASSVDDIVQDLYIGSYERRGVQLQNTLQQPQSIYDFSGSVVSFNDVEGSRLVKYVSGMRVQWKVEEGESS